MKKKNRVYLCGPINGKTDEQCHGWRDKATELLTARFNVSNPMSRDFRGIEDNNCKDIVEGDLVDIRKSDILLVNAEYPSWGTAMEIRYAYHRRKHIVIFTSAQSISPWLKYHANSVCKTLEEACYLLNTKLYRPKKGRVSILNRSMKSWKQRKKTRVSYAVLYLMLHDSKNSR